MTRWSGARLAPALRRTRCRDCGSEVDHFREPYGRPVYLDTRPPPITADLAAPEYRGRIYENHGPRVGWVLRFAPTRTWREVRAAHRCAPQHHENERENERE